MILHYWVVQNSRRTTDDPQIQEDLARLDKLQPGREDQKEYHEIAFRLVQFVFDWTLVNFVIEYEMDLGRGRIDIIADNNAPGWLLSELRAELNATTVPMECKNYSTDLGNNEFNQIADRLSPSTSRFGIVFCRTIHDQVAMIDHQGDRWLRHNKMILLIDDGLLREFVQMRLNRDFIGIDGLLRLLVRAVKYRSTAPISGLDHNDD